MTTKNSWFAFCAIALLLTAGVIVAQQPATNAAQRAASLDLNQPMPVESAITVGTLPNGLRYYIRTNKQPEKRAELRLVIKAGSVLEDADQQGLAHFLEHMAFNGTKNFPGESVVSFLQSTGMRFGADVNASTGFDETTYMLTVPTDKPEILEKSFLVLEDWAHNISLDPAEIDKERGVIMEEWRRSRGAGMRITERMFPILLKDSRYADRFPIGKPEVLQSFKPDQIKRFYTDWYRPDLMAVVAVGDFDRSTIEGLIKTHFAPIPQPSMPRPRPVYDVPDHAGTVFAILADKEITSTSVEIDNLLPAHRQGTVGVYRQQIVDSLFSSMLSARFAEMAQKSDAPFLGASVGRGNFIARAKDTASLSAVVRENGIEQGMDALISEAERVTRFGFTATELDRQKQGMIRAYERMVAQRDNRESASHAAEYIRNFVTNETLPGADLEHALHQRFLPGITLDEVNRLAKEWFSDRNRMVVVNAPEKPGLTLPDEAKLTAVLKTASAKTLTAYVDSGGSQPLIDTLPQPGKVVKTGTQEPGFTEWELSNGAKVVLKPTNFKADEILFRAYSYGGTSLASDADYIPASTATQVITAGGLGKFSAIDLRKALTGKVATARPFIDELEEGLTGSSSKQDLETMFQMIYLTFTSPRPDPTAFGVQATQLRTLLANQTAAPEYSFAKMLNDTLSQGHPRRQMTTPETVDRWNLDKSLAFYKERFADASGFTFFFVGDFDVESIKPFVERYIGGLPSLRREENWKDVGVRMPKGVIEKTVERGIEPKSQVALVFSGPFQYDQTQRVAIRAMAQVVQNKLRETIREELGGTYSIGVGPSVQKLPNPEFRLTIQFGCEPQRANDLVKRVLEEIERFKANGPTAQQTSDVKESLLREFEASIRQNSYLISQVAVKYQYGEELAGLWQVPEYYKKLDAPAIQQAAKTYFDMNNYVRVTLFPEQRPAQ